MPGCQSLICPSHFCVVLGNRTICSSWPLSSEGPLTFQGFSGSVLSEDPAVEEESNSQRLTGRRSYLATCIRGKEMGMAELCVRFLFWKGCAENNSTKCCCENRKPNLSVKNKI